jgi:formylmethanofuran--tetrahydromethanopterin N-formyltransferase
LYCFRLIDQSGIGIQHKGFRKRMSLVTFLTTTTTVGLATQTARPRLFHAITEGCQEHIGFAFDFDQNYINISSGDHSLSNHQPDKILTGEDRTLKLNGVEIEDTFAEGFPMYMTRLLITATTRRWAEASAQESKGLGTTAVFCPTEAGIEGPRPTCLETPDGRPGVFLQIGHQNKEKVLRWMPIRIRHCILSVPTTALFDAMPEELDLKPIEMKETPPYLFGDVYQEEIQEYGRERYRIPLMGGWFKMPRRVNMVKGVAGGNFLILGETQAAALAGAEAAVDGVLSVPKVWLPAVAGVFASGSKPMDEYPWATTNHRFCSVIRDKVSDTLVPEGVGSVFEVVVNGLTTDSVMEAMKIGIRRAATVDGVVKITAANYGGNLGPYKFHLREVL